MSGSARARTANRLEPTRSIKLAHCPLPRREVVEPEVDGKSSSYAPIHVAHHLLFESRHRQIRLTRRCICRARGRRFDRGAVICGSPCAGCGSLHIARFGLRIELGRDIAARQLRVWTAASAVRRTFEMDDGFSCASMYLSSPSAHAIDIAIRAPNPSRRAMQNRIISFLPAPTPCCPRQEERRFDRLENFNIRNYHARPRLVKPRRPILLQITRNMRLGEGSRGRLSAQPRSLDIPWSKITGSAGSLDATRCRERQRYRLTLRVMGWRRRASYRAVFTPPARRAEAIRRDLEAMPKRLSQKVRTTRAVLEIGPKLCRLNFAVVLSCAALRLKTQRRECAPRCSCVMATSAISTPSPPCTGTPAGYRFLKRDRDYARFAGRIAACRRIGPARPAHRGILDHRRWRNAVSYVVVSRGLTVMSRGGAIAMRQRARWRGCSARRPHSRRGHAAAHVAAA